MSRFTNFFWPVSFYPSDAGLTLRWSPDIISPLTQENTGNRTKNFTPFMWENQSVSVPGKEYEKTIQLYLYAKRYNDDGDAYDTEIHSGPEIVMVQTAEFPSTTLAYPWATSTSKCPYSDCGDADDDGDDDDDKRKLHPGAIAGIVLGSIFGITFFAFCCCCPFLFTKRKGNDDRTYIVGQGDEMTEDQREAMLAGAGLGSWAPKPEPPDTRAHRSTPVETPSRPPPVVLNRDNDMEIEPIEVERVEQRREEIDRENPESPPPYVRDAPPAYKP